MMCAPRLSNRPLALLPTALEALSVDDTRRPGAYFDATAMEPPDAGVWEQIAVIPVHGCLTNVRDWWFFGSSYDQITDDFRKALADESVKAIVMHVDSPGGLCAGCSEVAELIYANRGVKPVVAVVDSWACSAAYWIASACDMITMPVHAQVGHVGAVQQHFDITGALDQAGVVVTTVQFGANKTDLYPTTKMTDSTRTRLQADVDTIGEAFVTAVARNRGMSADKVRETQALSFLGPQAMEIGFVDVLMSPSDACQKIVADLQAA